MSGTHLHANIDCTFHFSFFFSCRDEGLSDVVLPLAHLHELDAHSCVTDNVAVSFAQWLALLRSRIMHIRLQRRDADDDERWWLLARRKRR